MTGKPDALFKALADPTRRALLDRLKKKPHTTGQLVAAFPDLSRCGVMKHLEILVEAGLVVVRREGRFRWNYLNTAPLQHVLDRWLTPLAGSRGALLSGIKKTAESKKSRRRY